MALTNKQRNAIFQATRDAATQAIPNFNSYGKPVWNAAADASESWMAAGAQQAAYNAALPAEFRNVASAQEKQFLFAATALARLPRVSIEIIATTALRFINNGA